LRGTVKRARSRIFLSPSANGFAAWKSFQESDFRGRQIIAERVVFSPLLRKKLHYIFPKDRIPRADLYDLHQVTSIYRTALPSATNS
jgi:hypothetical protein